VVLIVDDEPPIVHAVVRLLAFEAFTVLTAMDGAAALDILHSQTVAVILTDQHMPGMRGVELLRSARTLAPDASRILFSGHIDVELLRAAVNGGEVYRFVGKPWDDDELLQAVRQGVERWELLTRSRLLAVQARERAESVLAAGAAALAAHEDAGGAALAILDAMPIAALAVDLAGQVRLANLMARRAFPGLEPGTTASDHLPAVVLAWMMANGGGNRRLESALGPLDCEGLNLGQGGIALLGTPHPAYPGPEDLV
jgi:FixJ family two-component response regulator